MNNESKMRWFDYEKKNSPAWKKSELLCAAAARGAREAREAREAHES